MNLKLNSENYKEWLSDKKRHWRNYRSKDEIPPVDDTTSEIPVIDLVKGNGEIIVENSVEKIVDIGRKVELKLKETVFKQKFSDLKKSEYLRIVNLLTVCTYCDEKLPVNLPENCHFCRNPKSTPLSVIPVKPPVQLRSLDS